MELSLELSNQDLLTSEEKKELDSQIDEMIELHQKNRGEINNLVFESVTALTTSESRAEELANQGIAKRLWNGITGKNRKIRADIDRNFAKAQYASQLTLQKLAEQNLMTFELIGAVNNKLNSAYVEIDKIYEILIAFFRQTRSDVIQLQQRVEKLESNVNLLNWKNTIEYLNYNGVEYKKLPVIEQLVCITRDFYEITKGNGSASDFLLLKAAMNTIGLNEKTEIIYIDFIKYISENTELMTKLIDYDIEEIDLVESSNTNFAGIQKTLKLDTEQKYLIDTISTTLVDQGIQPNSENIKYSMVRHYMNNNANIDLLKSLSAFDYIVGLYNELVQIEIHLNSEAQNSDEIIEVCENENEDVHIELQTENIHRIKIFAGGASTMIIQPAGEWICFGGIKSNSKSLSDFGNIKKVKTKGNTMLLLDEFGEIKSIGEEHFKSVSIPKNLDEIKYVEMTQTNNYAIDANGKVYTWGSFGLNLECLVDIENIVDTMSFSEKILTLNTDGTVTAIKSELFEIKNLKNIIAISTGGNHCLALDKDGKVFAWGNNNQGQCNVPDIKDIIQIAAGKNHSLALDKNGMIFAWGENDYFQCEVPILKKYVSIAAGLNHSVAVDDNNHVFAWGSDKEGQCDIPKIYEDAKTPFTFGVLSRSKAKKYL